MFSDYSATSSLVQKKLNNAQRKCNNKFEKTKKGDSIAK